jgi:hypothetical protein
MSPKGRAECPGAVASGGWIRAPLLVAVAPLSYLCDMYVPGELPDVDAVEVVDLRGVAPTEAVATLQRARGAVRLEGAAAAEIAKLWRGLPPGEMMRCHIPGFGLRFWRGDQVVVLASLCWKCNNARGLVDDVSIGFSFDGDSQAARTLLRRCKAAVGDLLWWL